MDCASNFAFIKKKPAVVARRNSASYSSDEEINTNVISVNFKTLKQAEDNLQMGDAHFCKKCRSCLTSVSQLLSKDEYLAKYPSGNTAVGDNKEEEKKMEEEPAQKNNKEVLIAIADDERVWVCEFCGVHNLLNVDQEEVPKSDDVIFLLKSAQQISKDPSDLSSDNTTIFCIDNSGSMSVTTEIKGKHDFKHGLSTEEYEMLKQFIEYGADQYLPNQSKENTFISRKQCVLAAIEDQLMALKNDFPNRKVGLVTFDNEVCVIGDGKNVPETITGDKLYKYDILRQIGEDLGGKLVTETIKNSAEVLISKFEKLKESGKTALGPALLVSVGMAMKGKPGSRVIVCTDGLANIGLGEMDTADGQSKAEAFYTQVGLLAKESGVAISIISIKGEGCKLGILGNVADMTSGFLTKVDPDEITNKFASIMKNEVIGTQVDVKLRLHQAMKLRNEANDVLQEGGSLYQNNVGNVTAKTELTFEYQVKSDAELAQAGVGLNNLETVPFQAQIVYNSTSGDRLMRVITKTLKVTRDLEEAEEDVNVNILATRAIQEQGKLAAQQNYEKSNKVAGGWGSYLVNKIASKVGFKGKQVIEKYDGMNNNLQKAQVRRKAKKEKVVVEEDDYEMNLSDCENEMAYNAKNFNFSSGSEGSL